VITIQRKPYLQHRNQPKYVISVQRGLERRIPLTSKVKRFCLKQGYSEPTKFPHLSSLTKPACHVSYLYKYSISYHGNSVTKTYLKNPSYHKSSKSHDPYHQGKRISHTSSTKSPISFQSTASSAFVSPAKSTYAISREGTRRLKSYSEELSSL
jgi:hypothetical protein